MSTILRTFSANFSGLENSLCKSFHFLEICSSHFKVHIWVMRDKVPPLYSVLDERAEEDVNCEHWAVQKVNEVQGVKEELWNWGFQFYQHQDCNLKHLCAVWWEGLLSAGCQELHFWLLNSSLSFTFCGLLCFLLSSLSSLPDNDPIGLKALALMQ